MWCFAARLFFMCGEWFCGYREIMEIMEMVVVGRNSFIKKKRGE